MRTNRAKALVPLDEIVAGGPPPDGIPAIDRPVFVTPSEAAEWLQPREPVLGLTIGGDARAYPLQILMWHEIVNDVVGGIPVSVTFCPLCNRPWSSSGASTARASTSGRARAPPAARNARAGSHDRGRPCLRAADSGAVGGLPWRLRRLRPGRSFTVLLPPRHAEADHDAGHFHTVRLFPDRVAHLIAIAIGAGGWPTALFTVNLWAVGDAEDRVSNLKTYVRRFRLDERRAEADLSSAGGDGSRPLMATVTRFVNLVFEAFRPEIERLQEEKARTIEEYRPDMAAPIHSRTVRSRSSAGRRSSCVNEDRGTAVTRPTKE